jgi:hypothetical protein
MTKWIIGLGILVIIGVGLWWGGVFSSFMPSTPPPAPVATTTPQEETPAPVSDLPTQSNDASDAAILQDTAAIDAQMTSLDSDSANVDNGLNDKPVTQEF